MRNSTRTNCAEIRVSDRPSCVWMPLLCCAGLLGVGLVWGDLGQVVLGVRRSRIWWIADVSSWANACIWWVMVWWLER